MRPGHLRKIFYLLILLQIICLRPLQAELYLNEYLSMNVSTNTDEDNDFSDWIELYNSGPLAVNLSGYSLSDDESPFQWLFPEINLPVEEQILIFASGKDRSIFASHWETVIDQGDHWTYRVNTSAPPIKWRAVEFDDSAWSSGPTGIGYRELDCGRYDIAWSGAGESDQRLSPGIYFIQLQTAKKTMSRRVLLAE